MCIKGPLVRSLWSPNEMQSEFTVQPVKRIIIIISTTHRFKHLSSRCTYNTFLELSIKSHDPTPSTDEDCEIPREFPHSSLHKESIRGGVASFLDSHIVLLIFGV